jgi:glutamate formiminotransferase/formiminotetrahydrofolate cyclodeaminase
VGARFPLVAYNIYLNTPDLKIAQAFARAIRFSTGGLRYVKALGFEIKERNQVQVSMNLTNFEATPVFRVFEMVAREAERYGVAIVSSEIVGLVPQKALNACADFYLRLENFSASQILENRLMESLPQENSVPEFVASIAAPHAVPGGGSVAAHAASVAAALGEMMAGLTEGKKKHQAVDAKVREIHLRLTAARDLLHSLAQEDANAYTQVMAALKLGKGNAEEKTARDKAVERATRAATETPLRTAREAAGVLRALGVLAEIGNPNALSDAATGAQLACAALNGARYNVLINLAGIRDRAFADSCRSEIDALAGEAKLILARIDAMVK